MTNIVMFMDRLPVGRFVPWPPAEAYIDVDLVRACL